MVMNYDMKRFISLALATSALITCAHSIAESPEPELLNNADGQSNQWNGVGQIHRNGSRYCTAFLLDTRDSNNEANGPAYIATNAHCASIKTGTTTNKNYQGEMQFNYFADTLDPTKRYAIKKVSWASLASADTAIMELDTSLNALLQEGITPLKLASSAPANPTQVKVIGAPSVASGLRLSTCTQEPSNIVLIKYMTVHTNYQKQDCKGIAPGSSGSPVIDAATGEVTGVLSGTTYGLSDDKLCFWHGLCGENKTGSSLPDRASHSFPMDYLTACFTEGRFDIDASTCTLKPEFSFNSTIDSDVTLHKKPMNDNEETPSWGTEFTMSTAFYRYKTVRDAHACHLPENYSDIISTHSAKVAAPIGREEGLYYLCLVGVDTAEQPFTTGLLRNAQILPARIVEPVSTPLPDLTPPAIRTLPIGLLLSFSAVDGRNAWVQVYTGPPETTDCGAINLNEYENLKHGFLILNRYLPRTVCSYAMDRNFSTSHVRTDLVQHSENGE
ncbi:hypothetical protein DBR18_14540 [Pseudomonas sp. HMWF021]|nr:hypothetical protein DBR18_14540 [Pseudomonas sp. HMWF021]